LWDVIEVCAYAAEFAKAYIEDGASRGPLAANTQHWSGTMSEDMKAELERLRQENAALKKGASKGISMKVSEKGGLSIYGLGRFPVTLYKEQWTKLLELSDEIKRFLKDHDSELKTK
jgi:hypothetical protein